MSKINQFPFAKDAILDAVFVAQFETNQLFLDSLQSAVSRFYCCEKKRIAKCFCGKK